MCIQYTEFKGHGAKTIDSVKVEACVLTKGVCLCAQCGCQKCFDDAPAIVSTWRSWPESTSVLFLRAKRWLSLCLKLTNTHATDVYIYMYIYVWVWICIYIYKYACSKKIPWNAIETHLSTEDWVKLEHHCLRMLSNVQLSLLISVARPVLFISTCLWLEGFYASNWTNT